jgi:hypothetical protein
MTFGPAEIASCATRAPRLRVPAQACGRSVPVAPRWSPISTPVATLASIPTDAAPARRASSAGPRPRRRPAAPPPLNRLRSTEARQDDLAEPVLIGLRHPESMRIPLIGGRAPTRPPQLRNRLRTSRIRDRPRPLVEVGRACSSGPRSVAGSAQRYRPRRRRAPRGLHPSSNPERRCGPNSPADPTLMDLRPSSAGSAHTRGLHQRSSRLRQRRETPRTLDARR